MGSVGCGGRAVRVEAASFILALDRVGGMYTWGEASWSRRLTKGVSDGPKDGELD